MKKAALLAGLAFSVLTAPAFADTVYVQAGRLLADPATGKVETNKTIVVTDGKVVEIRDGFVGEAGKTVDLQNKFVLPGLIDAHVHLLFEMNPKSAMDAVTKSESAFLVDGLDNAKKTVRAGFTTVADLGAGRGNGAIYALRDGIKAGRIEGPIIIAAGSTVTPHGGHADVHGYNEEVLHALASKTTCSGADQCRQVTREEMKRGADIIKLTATGGVLSNTAAGLGQQFFDDELKAIIDTAHSMGRQAVAHAHGTEGINAALRNGVNAIEHGSFLDDQSLKLFKSSGAWLVPTLSAGQAVLEQADAGKLTKAQADKARIAAPKMIDATRRARDAGVKIAFGTDAGVGAHGTNGKEFALLLKAGLTPLEAIQTATTRAAEHLQIENSAGRIKSGLRADIIAVDADPLKDVTQLEQVKFVMAQGRIVRGN